MKDEETKVAPDTAKTNEVPTKEKKKEYKIINIRKTNPSFARNYEGYRNEIETLENEKFKLLSSGIYHDNDPLIIQMENKIKKLCEAEYN